MLAKFEEWKEAIRKYCSENNLDFAKACKTVRAWGPQLLVLQVVDPNAQEPDGLNTENPLPAVLIVRNVDGKLHFEQTKYTKMYLSN